LQHGFDIYRTQNYIFKDSEEESEHKQDEKNLFKRPIHFEYTILTAIWEDILEFFNKATEKLHTPDFDIYIYIYIYMTDNFFCRL
jgi:hypothetical protein